MNRQRAKELLPIIQAFADGKDIGVLMFDGTITYDLDDPIWRDNVRYRIKPEPREWWENVYLENNTAFRYSTKATAKSKLREGGKTIKVREVLDDE